MMDGGEGMGEEVGWERKWDELQGKWDEDGGVWLGGGGGGSVAISLIYPVKFIETE